MKSVISSKGQLTLPIEIRRLLGLDAGIAVEFFTKGNEVILRKSTDDSKVKKWRGKGKIPGGTSVDNYLKKLRE